MDELDKQLADIKAKRAKKKSEGATGTQAANSADREASRALVAAEREAKRIEREAARAAKKLAREANKTPAHFRKVEKALAKLPAMSERASDVFADATINLSANELQALSLHLAHFNRAKATERALSLTVAAGDTVKIVSGDPRFIGMTGTVTKAQRIRAYVQVEGREKPVYVFTSDCEVVSAQSARAVG